MNFTTLAANNGGHVRGGLEVSIHLAPGQLASSNAEEVVKIRAILESLGVDIAMPAEVCSLLALEGQNAL